METTPRGQINMETGITVEELKSPCYSPPAKKRKRKHNIYMETGFSQKEWEVVSILVKHSAKNNVSLNNDIAVKIDRGVNDYDDFKKSIDVGTDEDSFCCNCPEVRNYVNNNNDVTNVEKSKIKRLEIVMTMPCMRVFNMHQLLANDSRLEKIYLDEQNHFIESRYKSYRFIKGNARSDDELHEKANDFKYLINLCGYHLKCLNVEAYPFSQIMPLINSHCPNIIELTLKFKEIKSQDFENVFSNMSHIEILRINWQCKNSNLPLTLIKSLEQVGGTLKELSFSRDPSQNYICLPDSLISVFPQLIALKKLKVINFKPSQSLLQSIGEIKNLSHLRFMCSWLNNDPVFDKTINMYPIGNLKNLETLYINYDCGVTDEFLINLCNNSKKLTHLDIIGKNITDYGMIALNNLKQLESLKFNLNGLEKNDFITDQSIQCLVYEKLEYLHLSNCTRITDKSVLELFKNLPSLQILYVRNTKVTFDVIKDMLQITEYHKRPIYVYVSFEDRYDIFKLLTLSGVFFKSNFNRPKYIDILI